MFSTTLEHLKTQPFWILFLSLLGFFIFLKNSIFFLKWILISFLAPRKDLKKYGSWALVTGSTDGIGKAFAFQLAERGLNLILVSRNSSKLKQVSKEIQTEFPSTKLKIFELDLSSEDEDFVVARLHELEQGIKGLDIGVLINNVGVTYPRAMFFHEVEERVWMNLVKVNIKGNTWITKAVLPGMLRRKKGAILYIGSAAVVVPSHPLYAIYAATKAYINQLSRCLYVEYRHSGITIQCQVPVYVSTKMAAEVAFVEKPSMFMPTADKYVEAAIRRIGYDEARCSPYWSHSLQLFFASMLPDVVLDSWRLNVGSRRRDYRPT